jgi:hypothetical protein
MSLEQALELVVAKYRAAMEDGKLTWDEMVKLTFFAVALITRLAESDKDMSGADKKKMAIESLLKIFDSFVANITLPGVPAFFQPLVKSFLRETLAQVASPLIDALVELWNKIGWGDFDSEFDNVDKLDVLTLVRR